MLLPEINSTFLLEISVNSKKHLPYYPTTGGVTCWMYPTGYDKNGDRKVWYNWADRTAYYRWLDYQEYLQRLAEEETQKSDR